MRRAAMARAAYESGDLSSVRGDCLGRQCFQRHRNPPEARTPIRLMIRRAHRLQKGRRHAREERHHQRNAGADPGLLPLSVGWRGGSAGDGARGLRPRSPAAPGAPSMGGDRFPDHALCLHRACLCRHRWRWAFWPILVAFLPADFGAGGHLQPMGVLHTSTPTWYVPSQGSSAWFSSIALATLPGYRAAASGSLLMVATAEARWEACQQGQWPPDGRTPAAAALSADTPGICRRVVRSVTPTSALTGWSARGSRPSATPATWTRW
jgi:hypothetical protein